MAWWVVDEERVCERERERVVSEKVEGLIN